MASIMQLENPIAVEDESLTENTEKPPIKSEQKSRKKKTKQSLEKNSSEIEITKDIEVFPTDDDSESLSLTDTSLYDTTVEKGGNITKIFDVNSKMSKCFVVNETMFLDLEPTMLTDEEFHQYKLYKVMKEPTDKNYDELNDEDLTEILFVTEEFTKSGLIINNNVYLTYEQWNTITRLSEDMYSCSVCQFQCDSASVAFHLESLAHKRELDAHRPLKRFDLCITRKINDNFHCGVCNITFPVKSYRDHENSKAHEGNLLFAINKVCDLMYSGENTTTQMLNTNNIQAPNNAPCANALYRINLPDRNNWAIRNTESDRNSESDENLPHRNTESAARITEPYRNAESSRNSSPHRNKGGMDITYNRNTEACSNIESYNSESSSNINYINAHTPENTCNFGGISRSEHSFNFAKTFKDIKIYEEEEFEEYILPIEGVSYASMASKPRLDVPKFLKIDLGTKEVRVRFESWNMITQTNLNEYYCMVCKKPFHVRIKNQHCMDEEHRKMLARCAVVGAFEDYLIRDISGKLYHCGHCNNLQYKNDMQIHIEKHHPIKNPKNESKPPLKLPQTDIAINKGSVRSVTPKLDIFGDFKFCPFGAEITISNLSCHTLMLVDNKYLCALCSVYIQGELIEHVYEAKHMSWINMTPFIRPFRCNLTRAVRGSLHCAICNILIPVNSIRDHNIDPSHTSALARALGMVKNKRPKQEIKYQLNEPTEFNTELNRFLSTLPTDTRNALSKFKIKNPEGESFQLSNTSSSSTSSNGTPSHMSLNTSPVHVNKNQTLEFITQNQINNYPQIGAEHINQDPKVYHPRVRLDGIEQGPETYPRIGADNTIPGPGYFAGVNNMREAVNVCYPTSGMQGNPNNLTGQPLFRTGQFVSVSMIESELLGVRTGSPNSPRQLQITGPLETMNSRVRIPVTPIPRPGDMTMYNHSPVSHESVAKVEHKIEMKGNVPEKEVKRKDQEKATMESKKPKVRKTSLSDGSDEEEQPFILDEIVLLKLKSSYFKVSSTSYHTLVHLGNGARHCLVCSSRLDYSALRSHVHSREHIDNITKNKFLYNFSGQLFRQMYLTYHCGFCNVTMPRKEVKMHLEWPTHITKYDLSSKKISKKVLKDALKSGTKEICVETQKEFLYVNIPEPVINIVTYVQSSQDDFQETYVEKKLEKKNQLILLKGNMMKISFESWHGILITKSGAKCIVCQQELAEDGLLRHLEKNYHRVALGKTFEKQYFPALIRKINKNTVNCVICNLELLNDDSLVSEHISGRKHEKNYNTILEKTSHTDSYSDCYSYPITL